jgi:hypothetical protein
VAPEGYQPKRVAQSGQQWIEVGNAAEKIHARQRPERCAHCLTGCGERRHRAFGGNHKRAQRDCWPDAVAAIEKGSERNTIGRPHRSEIAASNCGRRLTEFARNEIGNEDDRQLTREFP